VDGSSVADILGTQVASIFMEEAYTTETFVNIDDTEDGGSIYLRNVHNATQILRVEGNRAESV
jgi:predicted transcriptional regulator